MKDAQVEIVKQNIENRSGLSETEKASAVHAVESAPLAGSDELQAANILKALQEFMNQGAGIEKTEAWQNALLSVGVVLGNQN